MKNLHYFAKYSRALPLTTWLLQNEPGILSCNLFFLLTKDKKLEHLDNIQKLLAKSAYSCGCQHCTFDLLQALSMGSGTLFLEKSCHNCLKTFWENISS